MASVTLDLPDDLAERLHPLTDRLPHILDLGLRALCAESVADDEDAAEVLALLVTLPSPENVLALKASPRLQERVRVLLEKRRTTGLCPEEELEWQRIEYVEHLVRLAKGNAALELKR